MEPGPASYLASLKTNWCGTGWSWKRENTVTHKKTQTKLLATLRCYDAMLASFFCVFVKRPVGLHTHDWLAYSGFKTCSPKSIISEGGAGVKQNQLKQDKTERQD